MDAFGIGFKCLSKRDVRLIESHIRDVKRGRDQRFVKFQVVVVQQQWQRNVTKNVLHVQRLFFFAKQTCCIILFLYG